MTLRGPTAALTVRGAGGLEGLMGGLRGGPGEDRGLVPEHHDHHLDEAVQVRLGLEHTGRREDGPQLHI